MTEKHGGAACHATMAAFFDDYVQRVFPARRAAAEADWLWPGDEWADEELREATWDRIVGPMTTPRIRRIVEIGPGAGKYTEMALTRTPAQVTAYEISAAFLAVIEDRFRDHADRHRLDARHIAWPDNEGLVRDYGQHLGTADLWFAIDVLMMMDFQSALTYIISAASMLRVGGRLVATFADGGTQSGLDRMLRDVGRHSAFDAAPCTRFHWVDRPMLERVLQRLGFGNLVIEHGPEGGLDIARLYVQAELLDRGLADRLRRCLLPSGDSTNRYEAGSN